MQKYTFKYICKSIDEKLLKKTPSFSSKKWCWQTIYFSIYDQNILLEERWDSKETFFPSNLQGMSSKKFNQIMLRPEQKKKLIGHQIKFDSFPYEISMEIG